MTRARGADHVDDLAGRNPLPAVDHTAQLDGRKHLALYTFVDQSPLKRGGTSRSHPGQWRDVMEIGPGLECPPSLRSVRGQTMKKSVQWVIRKMSRDHPGQRGDAMTVSPTTKSVPGLRSVLR